MVNMPKDRYVQHITEDKLSCNISTLASTDCLERAFLWLCEQRKERSHNNSVWHLRFNWPSIKPILQQMLQEGEYRLSPLQSHLIDIECIEVKDAPRENLSRVHQKRL